MTVKPIFLPTILVLLLMSSCGNVLAPTPEPTLTPAPTSTLQAAQLPTLASTQVPSLSPLISTPTVTPSPSPTPIIYVVQAGDTLIAIAVRHGVTLDSLMLTNPEIKPELLQLGQRVIIPHETASNQAGLLYLSPTPLPLDISGLGTFQTPTGGLWVLGEVINPTDSLVENVTVAISLVDSDGSESEARRFWTASDRIPAGGSAPFGALFTNPPDDLLAPRVDLVAGAPSTNSDAAHPDLVATEHAGNPAGALFRVSGRIQNQGVEPADGIIVQVTLYNQSGQVTGFRLVPIADPLMGGEEIPFDVRLTPAGPDTSTYHISVSGRIMAPAS